MYTVYTVLWLLFNANSEIVQLYHGENKFTKSPKQRLGDLMFLLRFLLLLLLLLLFLFSFFSFSFLSLAHELVHGRSQ